MTYSRPASTPKTEYGVRPVSQPTDRAEREADRAADVAARGLPVSDWSITGIPISRGVQRQEAGGEEKTEKEKYIEAAKKTGEAVLETEAGKKLKEKVLADPTVKKIKDAATSPVGLGVGLAAVAGGVTALALMGKELPIQPPEIPLDKITPGLSGKVTYTGPVNAPTFVGITITYREQGPETAGPKKTGTEKLRGENASLAAELAAFRQGLRYPPGSKEAEEQRMIQEAIAKMVFRSPTQFGPPAVLVPLAEPAQQKKEQPVQRAPASAEPAHVTEANVDAALNEPGRPLDPDTRRRMEARFDHDFSAVRIHDDARSSAVAASLDAAAFTVDDHIVFGAGRFDPRSPQGAHLLAHELTHVVQQGRLRDQVYRQRAGAPSPATTFSVDRREFEVRVQQALVRMSTRLVTATTFAPALLPILQAMARGPTWRDPSGRDHGGKVERFTVPGTANRVLNLRLVLDDMKDPPQEGSFSSRGRSAELIVQIRKVEDLDDLTEILFHEALHMMAWIINEHQGIAAVAQVERRAVRGLQISRLQTQIAGIRRVLDSLAQNANRRRRLNQKITPQQLERMAGWLMEEVQVRAETEIFRLARRVDVQRSSRGPRAYLGTSAYGNIDLRMVDRYVFDHSGVFSPADRNGLTGEDRRSLRRLMEILEGFFQLHVRRRFSLTAYTSHIPRATQTLPRRRLTPPSFIPRILESTTEDPF